VKAKKRRAIERLVRGYARSEFQAQTMPGVFHVLSVRFEEGRALDIPYEPWRPRQTINLPGRWVRDEDPLSNVPPLDLP
jgi:hypothetical protein